MITPILVALLGTAAPSPDTLGKDALPLARKALEADLVDYPRARFRDMHAVAHADGKLVFCGMLNAPNRMGGMTGWSPVGVLVTGEARVVSGNEDNIRELALYGKLCPIPTATFKLDASVGAEDFSPALSAP